MAIRKTVEEEFIVNGNKDAWFANCTTALDTGGFKDIKENTTLSQIEAKFKSWTVAGTIVITLSGREGETKIKAAATGNMDNAFALFASPNRKILSQFKDNLNQVQTAA